MASPSLSNALISRCLFLPTVVFITTTSKLFQRMRLLGIPSSKQCKKIKQCFLNPYVPWKEALPDVFGWDF